MPFAVSILRAVAALGGACWLLGSVLSCGGQPVAQASGAQCDGDAGLTYENFGREFMTQYCIECHSSQLGPSARRGAPSEHNFDTLEGIRATEPGHIDEVAAAGPNIENTAMPSPGYPAPSSDDRLKLGQWLACGTP